MNRSVSFLVGMYMSLSSFSFLHGQEIITPLAGNPASALFHQSKKVILKSALSDTLELPFFDDFSNSYIEPDPTLWDDADAFINNNYCIDPLTNGVATLDIIDAQGSIYPGATKDPLSFSADHLTSHPIKLNFPPSDSLYLSFLYQPGGLGDLPEEQDSLLLDFYSASDTAWINVWGTPGTGLHPFRTVMIPIRESRYLNDRFRFRFRNRGSLPSNPDYPDKNANVDHWNIDYIKLDRNRFAADTILRDVAFNTAIKSVLIDLTSLPWSHFEDAKDNVFDQTTGARYRNNDTILRNITRNLLIQEPLYGESYTPGQPTAQDLPPMEDTLVQFDYFYPINASRGDSAIVRLKASLRTDEFDPKVNDTIIYDQVFSDYYSYDDGSPEAGYGLRGQGTRNGNVAVKYFAHKADELGGVDISFNQLEDSLNMDYYFKLIVWSDNGGIPGNVLFTDDKDLTPEYSRQFPGFVRYYFSEPVPVDGTFYVGWRQYNQYMLNVGLDLNNRPSPHVLYYNYQGTWTESNAPGVILLRPFMYDETTGVNQAVKHSESLLVYPNPASDHIFIETPGSDRTSDLMVEVYDASGRLVIKKLITNGQLELSGLSGGIYFLKANEGSRIYHSKVMLSK